MYIRKDIVGYEGKYEIDTNGNVFSNSEKKLKGTIDSNGYITVSLYNDSKRKTFRVHRLVATCFIENGCNKQCINHIDGDKCNNCVDNLEWCTYSENMVHAFKNKLKNNDNQKRAVLKIDLSTNEILCKYESISYACLKNDTDVGSMFKVLTGKRKTLCGFRWEYAT